MERKNTTPPPAGVATAGSPTSPPSKRLRTSAEDPHDRDVPRSQPADGPAASPVEDVVEADDDNYSDSGFGTDTGGDSDNTSVASSIYAGYLENGRRYQTYREGEYYQPSDEKQFEAQLGTHFLNLVVDSRETNPLFRAPVSDNIQNILDIGTGNGAWAKDAADRYPSARVQGVDLYPPPDTWVPPNCEFIVDDVLKPWEFGTKFDYIHLRYMYGSFTDQQWKGVYKQAYEHLAPGGWIEQQEPDITFRCDDGTQPADSLMTQWGPMFIDCCRRAGKPLDTADTMKSCIQNAGFTNIHEQTMKVPFGNWAKDKLMKEAGAINKEQMMQGMEGYTMFLLTHFGLPTPWDPAEVQVYLAKVRKEMNSGFHTYMVWKRVWAQKPYDAAPKGQLQV